MAQRPSVAVPFRTLTHVEIEEEAPLTFKTKEGWSVDFPLMERLQFFHFWSSATWILGQVDRPPEGLSVWDQTVYRTHLFDALVTLMCESAQKPKRLFSSPKSFRARFIRYFQRLPNEATSLLRMLLERNGRLFFFTVPPEGFRTLSKDAVGEDWGRRFFADGFGKRGRTGSEGTEYGETWAHRISVLEREKEEAISAWLHIEKLRGKEDAWAT